jgi:hypothetical protein
MSTQIRDSVGVSLGHDGDPVNHGRSPFNGNGSDPSPLAPTLVGSQVAFTTRGRLRRNLRVLCYRRRTLRRNIIRKGDMSLEVSDLCNRGYFPKELPPLFDTSAFANYVDREADDLPVYKLWTTPTTFNLRLPGGARRPVAILHPRSFLEVARAVSTNWEAMNSVYGSSGVLNSAPIISHPGTSNRVFKGELTFGSRPMHRARACRASRYVYRADFSKCYASIYTHSLTWAFTDKATVREMLRGDKDLIPGNDLDCSSQRAQDGQTKGLPIGPDTSLALAELILCSIDLEFGTLMSRPDERLNALRMIDDFEYFAKSQGEAEEASLQWETAASRYGLTINNDKTSICEVPYIIQTPWVVRLLQYQFGASAASSLTSELSNYFSLAFELCSQNRSEGVLAFAINRLLREGLATTKDMESNLIDLLLPSILIEPSSIRFLLKALWTMASDVQASKMSELHETLNELIAHHAPLEHSAEVAWATFALHQLGLTIDNEPATKVVTMDDNVCLILLRAMEENGLVDGPGLAWEDVMSRSEPAEIRSSPDWLLAYESAANGWNNGATVREDDALAPLLAAGVRFFDFLSVPTHALIDRAGGTTDESAREWYESGTGFSTGGFTGSGVY